MLTVQSSFGYDETVAYYVDGYLPVTERFADVKKRAMSSI